MSEIVNAFQRKRSQRHPWETSFHQPLNPIPPPTPSRLRQHPSGEGQAAEGEGAHPLPHHRNVALASLSLSLSPSLPLSLSPRVISSGDDVINDDVITRWRPAKWRNVNRQFATWRPHSREPPRCAKWRRGGEAAGDRAPQSWLDCLEINVGEGMIYFLKKKLVLVLVKLE